MEHKNITIWIIVAIVVVVAGVAYAMTRDDGMMMEGENAMMQNDSGMQGPAGVMVGGAMMTADRNIVENASNASNVTTVVAAVSAAGLAETLQGPGPFTVFAPNNGAFEKLPDGTVETLLLPENKAMLADILTYHVVAGRYTAADLRDGQTLTTVQGGTILIGKSGSRITVNGSAMVETADVISSNGVTFVIDTVLMPPTQMGS
ncbi:MAG: fasciclin domain-containing protein [Patescibacteria group bacterium]